MTTKNNKTPSAPGVPELATPVCSDFLGYAEPMGATILLHSASPRRRLAMHFFRSEMFRYFENLASGQTGWGIDFNCWLGMHGWELIGYKTYKRVQGMEDDAPND